MDIIGTQSEENLLAALAGESLARSKYVFFAEKARQENKPQVAELFEKLAVNETAHARLWFKYLEKLGPTEENLEEAIRGEHAESASMYPDFARQALEDGLPELARLFTQVGAIEALHEQDFRKALRALGGGEVPQEAPAAPAPVYVCGQCGDIRPARDPDLPYACRVCGALGMIRREMR